MPMNLALDFSRFYQYPLHSGHKDQNHGLYVKHIDFNMQITIEIEIYYYPSIRLAPNILQEFSEFDSSESHA